MLVCYNTPHGQEICSGGRAMMLPEKLGNVQDLQEFCFSLGGSVVEPSVLTGNEERHWRSLVDVWRYWQGYPPKETEQNFEMNTELLGGFIHIVHELSNEGKTVAVTTGGGLEARKKMTMVDKVAAFLGSLPRDETADKLYGKPSRDLNKQKDHIGIEETKSKASMIYGLMLDMGLRVDWHRKPEMGMEKPGWVYIRGGYEEGMTTDGALVKVMEKMKNAQLLINITNVPGIYEVGANRELLKDRVIKVITYSRYITIMGNGEHIPGMNSPLEPQAAKWLNQQEKVAIVVGPNMANMKNMLKGCEFEGTVLIPDTWAA